MAHFAPSGGFLGVGGWRLDPVPVLDAASAAAALLSGGGGSGSGSGGGDPSPAALLWLDEARRDLAVSLRGACGGVETHPLRLRLELTPSPPGSGAAVHIALQSRATRDFVQQLARHALPTWERVCADAAGRCLWVAGGAPWLALPRAGGDAAAVALERADGRVRGAVALEVGAARVVALPLQGCGSAASEPVRSLDDALRALCRWATAKPAVDVGPLAAVAALAQQQQQQQQQQEGALRKALATMEAAIEAAGPSSAADVAARWLDAGMVPALLDHAAAMGPQPPQQQQPLADSPTRRGAGAGDQQPNRQRHATAIISLLARATHARRAEQAGVVLRCICSRLDGATADGAAPLLELLLGLLDAAAPAAPGSRSRSAEEAAAAAALSEAATGSWLLLEVLQALYARAAWQLPEADTVVRLQGAQGVSKRLMYRACAISMHATYPPPHSPTTY